MITDNDSFMYSIWMLAEISKTDNNGTSILNNPAYQSTI